MPPTERRFTTAYRQVDRNVPGLVQEDDGTVWLVNPDGTRTELPGGGGGSSVSCQLLAPDLDVGAVGNYALLWSALQDDPWNENPLLAIPAGLGMAFAFDGSDSTLTTTDAGTWALSLAFAGGYADTDWRGVYDDGLWGRSRFVSQPGLGSALVSDVMTLPLGAQLQPQITTEVEAAAEQHFNASLLLTRLARPPPRAEAPDRTSPPGRLRPEAADPVRNAVRKGDLLSVGLSGFHR